MGRYITLNEALYQFMLSVSVRDQAILQRLRAETEGMPNAIMQIPPEQGAFMALLLKMIGAKRTLEIGVFTGYSSLITAQALPDDGVVVACDVSEEWTAIAQRYWREAGVDHKIQLHIAPALDTLAWLISEGAESFDFAFIDADKPNTDAYYEYCLQLVRPNGLIAVDNALQSGLFVDPEVQSETLNLMRAFLEKVYQDQRVDISLVPIADGLLLARKR